MTVQRALNQELQNISTVSSALCTGCAACSNVCPHHAIDLVLNDEGFWQPYVKNELCLNCGLCKKVCPAEEIVRNKNPQPECYAVMVSDEDLRRKSSSGGVFGLLAAYVRAQKGYVCGAAFAEGMKLRHVIVSPRQSLEPLLGSKYLQSYVGDTLKEIKKLLEQGKKVLFCGTPCQVAGLNKFLNKTYENLLTADLMCHGGASPGAFAKYIRETFPNQELVDYRFREKTILGWGYSENAYLKDGTESRRIKGASTWFKMFRSCISVRECCGSCKAASLPRQGDFTLADAWLIRQISPSFDDGHGTSIVSVNSAKAKAVFNKLQSRMKLCSTIPLEWVLTHGQPFAKPFKATPFHHRRFFELLKSNSFERAATYTMKGKFDVAVMGVWFGYNYGSLLTYYSLYTYLRELGLLVLMVEKPPLQENDPELDPNFHSRKFCIRHYGDRISRMRLPHKMYELNRFADTFVVGSDQVLHKNCVDYFQNSFLLNFVDDCKKKIMYSSSFGHEKDFNSVEKRKEIGFLLNRFDNISLREESGVQIIQKNYGIHGATVVMDSMFLNDKKFYEKLAEESERQEEEPFIATYILDPDTEIKEVILHIAKKMNCKHVNMLDGATWKFKRNQENLGLEAVENLEAQDLVYYFIHAKYIITDSYHGTCLAILFNKNFVTIANKKRGKTRFTSIMNLCGLQERLYDNANEIINDERIFNDIEYGKINKIVKYNIDKSKKWLKNALYSSKKIVNEALWEIEVENNKFDKKDIKNYTNCKKEDDSLIKCIDIYEYIDKLIENSTRYLILISVKDTVGYALNKKIAEKLNVLAVKNDLTEKHWFSFIAVIDEGENIYEVMKENEPVHYRGYVDGNAIEMDSQPFKAGNVSRIFVNGKDFSLNRRGLNFVIFDKAEECVVDSVNFDTHVKQLFCMRVE